MTAPRKKIAAEWDVTPRGTRVYNPRRFWVRIGTPPTQVKQTIGKGWWWIEGFHGDAVGLMRSRNGGPIKYISAKMLWDFERRV